LIIIFLNGAFTFKSCFQFSSTVKCPVCREKKLVMRSITINLEEKAEGLQGVQANRQDEGKLYDPLEAQLKKANQIWML